MLQFTSYADFFEKSKQFVVDGHKTYVWWLGPFRCTLVVIHPDTVKVLLRSTQPKAGGGGGYDFLKPWIGWFEPFGIF